MSAPAIFIKKACLCRQGQWLFRQLNFDLPAGETTCLLGPSGVGKTSLLRLIAGLDPEVNATLQTSDGLSLSGRMAYMTQSHSLLPWLTVLNNVLLGYRLRRAKNLPLSRAYTLLEQIGLKNALQKKPAQLSGGMQQRVALARILLEDRSVLLMDEPFSALDTITRFQLHEIAADALRGRTVLLVTHDPLEALRLGHHIAIMSGHPAQIERLKLPFTADPPRPYDQENLLQQQSTLLTRLREHAQ